VTSPFTLDVARGVERIRRHERRVRCYVSTRLDEAIAEASERASEAPRSALHGLPYGLKDEFDTRTLPTTAGSWRHRDRRTDHDSTPARVFTEAGAVLVGKTNLSDMGLAPEASSYVGGSTRNPFDHARTAGGSSGGSAAAVAYGFQAFDWGTDIGGSIRLPAAFCGVLGMRLSHASWPLRELFPRVPRSLEWLCGQGPFTRTTAQMRAVLDVAEPHLKQGTFTPFTPRAVRLMVPGAGEWPAFERDVRAVLEPALGLPVEPDRDLQPLAFMREAFGAMWSSHFEELLESDPSIDLGRGLAAVLSAVGLRGRFGDRRFHPLTAELLLMIAIGRVTIFRDRGRARERAIAVRDAFQAAWSAGDLVIAPVTAHPPPHVHGTNRVPQLIDLTIPGNLSDATALAIPFGTFDGWLPRAIQLMGPPGSERVLLDLADRIIAERDRHPELRQPDVELP
jgi:amidase